MPTTTALIVFMNRYHTLLLLLVFLNTSVLAEETTDWTSEDRQLINFKTQDYNLCVQQNAVQQLDNYDDIRQVAAQAVDLCEHQLKELRDKLGSKAKSGYYSGLERHIKSRAIRKLLPLLMFEKSSKQATAEES